MHFSIAGGRTVAADINTMFGSVDTAILDTARLTASVMETKQGSDISPAKSQRVLDSLSAGFAKFVDGRKEMVAAHRALVVIKGESNLQVEDYGCYSVGLQAQAAQESALA